VSGCCAVFSDLNSSARIKEIQERKKPAEAGFDCHAGDN